MSVEAPSRVMQCRLGRQESDVLLAHGQVHPVNGLDVGAATGKKMDAFGCCQM